MCRTMGPFLNPTGEQDINQQHAAKATLPLTPGLGRAQSASKKFEKWKGWKMAGDNGAVVNPYSIIRVLHLPNTEEPFEQAEIAPTRSHKSAPLTLVAPSGIRGEKPELKRHQPRAKEETE